MNPKVSIILPVYNGAKWIEKSVQSALKQSFRDFELLIINDCSVDKSEEVILELAKKDFRIIYIKNSFNLGLAKTLNAAIAKAKGEYIARLDQDDEWLDEQKLEKQLEFFSKNPDYVLLGTGAVVVDENGLKITRYLMPQSDHEIRNKILRMNCFIHTSVMFRKSSVEKLGGYRPEKMSEDHDMWLRLGRVGKFANLPEYSVQYLLGLTGINSQNKILRLKQNMLFAREHKDFYPNYLQAVILGWAKLIFLPVFSLLSPKLKGFFLNLHKKI